MRKALLFLGLLDDSDLDWMIAAGTKREVVAGTVLIEEGHRVEWLFVVLDGAFSVTKEKSGASVARLMRGEMIGEISFVDRRPPTASVRALEKSLVLAIPRQDIESKLNEDVHFASRFYKSIAVFLADRLRTTLGMLGYGGASNGDNDQSDELDPEVLDRVSIAGARFEWLNRRLKAI